MRLLHLQELCKGLIISGECTCMSPMRLSSLTYACQRWQASFLHYEVVVPVVAACWARTGEKMRVLFCCGVGFQFSPRPPGPRDPQSLLAASR